MSSGRTFFLKNIFKIIDAIFWATLTLKHFKIFLNNRHEWNFNFTLSFLNVGDIWLNGDMKGPCSLFKFSNVVSEILTF